MYEGRRSAITLLVTTERALWNYDNVFLFTNDSEIDFGIAHVIYCSLYTRGDFTGLKTSFRI